MAVQSTKHEAYNCTVSPVLTYFPVSVSHVCVEKTLLLVNASAFSAGGSNNFAVENHNQEEATLASLRFCF